MAKESHYVLKVLITGTKRANQTITFASLTNDEGDTVPNFSAAPMVSITSAYQDRFANVIDGSITTEQFVVSLSSLRGAKTTVNYFDIEIRGDAV